MGNRTYLLLAALSLGGASAGCATWGGCEPHAKVGWHAGIYRPGVLVSGPNVTAVTSAATSGLVGIDQNTAMTGMPGPVASSSVAEGHWRARVGSAGLAAHDCTLRDLCERLDRIEQRLGGGSHLPPLQPQRMPKAATPNEPCP